MKQTTIKKKSRAKLVLLDYISTFNSIYVWRIHLCS